MRIDRSLHLVDPAFAAIIRSHDLPVLATTARAVAGDPDTHKALRQKAAKAASNLSRIFVDIIADPATDERRAQGAAYALAAVGLYKAYAHVPPGADSPVYEAQSAATSAITALTMALERAVHDNAPQALLQPGPAQHVWVNITDAMWFATRHCFDAMKS